MGAKELEKRIVRGTRRCGLKSKPVRSLFRGAAQSIVNFAGFEAEVVKLALAI